MHSARSLVAALLALSLPLLGCPASKPPTEVPPPPSVESFTSSALSVDRGQKVTLSWTTANATEVELREATGGRLEVPVNAVAASFEVTIDAASLFVLVARGPGGSDARALSVNLTGQALGEISFQALPPVIPGGASATLAWTAPGASSVSLSAGGQPVDIAGQRTNGAVTVTPAFDTTYTLTADGVMKSVTVTVQAALLDAELTPRAAEVGDTATVRWTAAGADRLVLSSPGRGQLFETSTRAEIQAGSFADVVPPTPDNGVVRYELTAFKGTTQVTRSLELNVGTGLAITRFEAPPVAGLGVSYSVRWETRAADLVELKVDGITIHQTSAAQGFFAFTTPMADFAVELIATNARGGRVSQVAQVDAVGVPTSATLTANPTSVAIGQPVTLTFAAAETRRARIVDSAGEVVFSVSGLGAEAGTATVYPTSDTTYTLWADNLLGNPPVSASAAVTVTGTAATVSQFPPTALSGQNVTLSTSATGALLYGFPHAQVLESTQAAFTDISGTGQRVLESGSSVTSVDLPFTTFLWGQRRTGPLTISRAGWMAWGAPLLVNSSNATSLPSASGAPGLIAPFWDDLTLVAGSGVFVQVVGEAPDQSLIVQWDKVQVGTDASTQLTFQAKVHQQGMVSFQYRTMTLAAGYTSFAVGVQDQTRQLGVRPTAAPATNSAFYFFSPLPPPLDVRVVRGSSWGGFIRQGALSTRVTRAAGAYSIPLDLGLTELMFRPHAAVPNGQYLEVVNRTSGPLDLSGWELRSPGSPTFQVPQGFVLQPGVPGVIGASSDPAENDDAGVTLSWGASGFVLSPDAGSFAIGTADAGAGFTYTGPADGGRGQAIEVDPGPFVGTTGSPGLVACNATTVFGSQTPQQLGSPGRDVGCGFGYSLVNIPARFVDISDGGTSLINNPTAVVTASTVAITLAATAADPAPTAFGARRDVVSMSLDGWLFWGSSTSSVATNATTTSTTSTTKGKLAVFWDDLQTSANVMPASEMYWKRFAANEDPATPAQHWVFQWAHVRHTGTAPADDLNFEVKLFEDGTIEYHYAALTSGTVTNYGEGSSATVWLEKPDGTQALVVGINQAVIRPNTAYRFVPR